MKKFTINPNFKRILSTSLAFCMFSISGSSTISQKKKPSDVTRKTTTYSNSSTTDLSISKLSIEWFNNPEIERYIASLQSSDVFTNGETEVLDYLETVEPTQQVVSTTSTKKVIIEVEKPKRVKKKKRITKVTTTLSRLQQIIKNSDIYDSNGNTIVYQERKTGKIYFVSGNKIVAEYEDEIAYGGHLRPDPEEVTFDTTFKTTSATTTTTLSRLQQIINNSDVYDSNGNTIVYQERKTGKIYVVFGNKIVAEYEDEIAYGGHLRPELEESKTYTKKR